MLAVRVFSSLPDLPVVVDPVEAVGGAQVFQRGDKPPPGARTPHHPLEPGRPPVAPEADEQAAPVPMRRRTRFGEELGPGEPVRRNLKAAYAGIYLFF